MNVLTNLNVLFRKGFLFHVCVLAFLMLSILPDSNGDRGFEPFLVSVHEYLPSENTYDYLRPGTLISLSHVVTTAAHLINKELVVAAGSRGRNYLTAAHTRKVVDIIRHEKFEYPLREVRNSNYAKNVLTAVNNIALLILESNFPDRNQFIRPISLQTTWPLDDEIFYMYSWPCTDHFGMDHFIMEFSFMKRMVVNDELMQKYQRSGRVLDTDKVFFAESIPQADPFITREDEGAPLVRYIGNRATLIGICVCTKRCETLSENGMFANVTLYEDWLERKMGGRANIF